MAERPVVEGPPLAGRRVLVTRAAAQASTFVRLLREAGAEVLEAPTITIGPPATWTPLDNAIGRLQSFQWVIFTSVNGVAMFEERLEHHRLGWRSLGEARVAAIGPATAAALSGRGVRADVVPAEYRAEGLLDRLAPLVQAGDAVLLPRAEQSRDLLGRGLAERGAVVEEVPAYRTQPAAADAVRVRMALARGEVDVVTFTSSSTARNFASLFSEGERREWLGGIVVACIGPVTAETAASFGLATGIMPAEYTIPALARAISEHFATGPGGR